MCTSDAVVIENAWPAEPASPSSSLVGLETSGDPLAVQSRYQDRLHRRHAGARTKIIGALHTSADEKLERRAQRMGSCGACPMVGVSSTGSISLQGSLCKDRLCPHCAGIRGAEATAAIAALVKSMNAPKHITLTMPMGEEPLRERCELLAIAWKRLRQTHLWKRSVLGGVYAVEVTRGAADTHWHVHLHVLVDSCFIPQAELSSVWERCSGGGIRVWIEAVHDRQEQAAYVAGYVCKPDKLPEWERDQIAEFATAMHGRRVLHTFGSLHGQKADPKPEPECNGEFSATLPLRSIEERSNAGDADATFLIEYMCRQSWSIARLLREPPLPYASSPQQPITEQEQQYAGECFARVEAAVWRCVAGDDPPPEPQRTECAAQRRLFADLTPVVTTVH